MGEEATKNLKVTPTMHGALELECDERGVSMQHVAAVLLSYGLNNIEVAFAEWHQGASERVRRRKQKPTQLRPVNPADSETA
jgi:hypothetical protein